MKQKILLICIIGIFLTTGLTTSALAKEENINENINEICYIPETSMVSGSVYWRSSPDNPVVAPLPDALVQLIGVSCYSAYTASNGEFTISDVNYGSYTIKVSKEGYNSYEDNIIINEPTVNLDPITLVRKKIVAEPVEIEPELVIQNQQIIQQAIIPITQSQHSNL